MNRATKHHDFDFGWNAGVSRPLKVNVGAPKQKLLLVEDDLELRSFLTLVGESHGYEISHTPDGRDALDMIAQNKPHAVLLDWSIQTISGIEVCRRLRADRSTSDIAIVMISGRGDEDDRVQGLTSGADDYLVKPFSSPELFARLRAILRRRCRGPAATPNAYGDILLDMATRKVFRAGRAISLRPREFDVLRHLIERPERVVSHENLLWHIWGSDPRIQPGAVAQTISRLRRALSVCGLGDPIRTVRAQGYSLDHRRS